MAYAMSDQVQPDIYHHLPAGIGQVRKLLDTVQAEMQDAQVAASLSDTTQIILAEVLNNVVEHAYRCADGHQMEVSIWLCADGVTCEVCDEGEPMPTNTTPAGVMPMIDREKPDTLPEGGFGWALIHDLTHDIHYVRRDGRNRLRFVIPAAGPTSGT